MSEPMSDERLAVLRVWSRDGHRLSFAEVDELFAEIDRLRALSVVPEGAVKVRVAVVMSPDGHFWNASGWSTATDKSMMQVALEETSECFPTAFIECYVMPPKPAEVAGVVENFETKAN